MIRMDLVKFAGRPAVLGRNTAVKLALRADRRARARIRLMSRRQNKPRLARLVELFT